MIVDGHVLWYFLPESLKIFLEVDINEAAKRLFEEKRSSEKENKTLEDTKQGLINRAAHEEKRYSSVYNLEYRNLDNFDLVINTTNMNPKEVVNKILEHINSK
jgi:cytidylate kinase